MSSLDAAALKARMLSRPRLGYMRHPVAVITAVRTVVDHSMQCWHEEGHHLAFNKVSWKIALT